MQTATEYDAEGQVVFESYPFSGTAIGTRTEYDALGRPTTRTNPDRSSYTLTYGNGTVTVVDEANRSIVQSVAAFGDPNRTRLVNLRDAAGQTWGYQYDALDQLRVVTAPGGTRRTWVYQRDVAGNSSDRLAEETHPESGRVTFGYDAGRLSRRTDNQSTVSEYRYDANDRVASITAGSQTTSFTYESGSDQRRTASVDGVVTTFDYDAAGRLASRTDQLEGNPFRTAFSYSATDDLTGIEYPSRSGTSRRRLTIDYNNEHQPIAVRDGTRTYASGATYHPSGAVQQFQSGNGLANTFGYDPQRYWPTSVSAAGWTLTYGQYDAVGNVGRINDSRGATYRQTFGYDALDRLTGASGIYGSITYAYDALGNPQTAGNTTYTIDQTTLHLLQQGGTTFGYDNNGNLTSDGVRTYTYTPQNQVATVTSGAGVTRYAYDPDQWRVKKSVPSQPTTYYIRGPLGELLTEWRTNGTTARVKDYVKLGSRLVATVARDYPEPPTQRVCTPVINYDFNAMTGPLYPTNSPGGPNFSLPNYWQTPVWPDPSAALWGQPLSTFPNMVLGQATDIVNGKLTYLGLADAQIAAAGFGQADAGSFLSFFPLFNTHNNDRSMYAEADVEFSAEAYNDATYWPMFMINVGSLHLDADPTPNGPVNFYVTWSGPEQNGERQTLVHTMQMNQALERSHRVRIEAKPSSPINPSDPQDWRWNADGVVRVLVDDVVVFERTGASLVFSGGFDVPSLYNVSNIFLGLDGIAGAYSNLRFGYCTGN